MPRKKRAGECRNCLSVFMYQPTTKNKGWYCSRHCALQVNGLVRREGTALKRIASRPMPMHWRVRAEVLALKRIAKHRPNWFFSGCVCCGKRQMRPTLARAICFACQRAKARALPSWKANKARYKASRKAKEGAALDLVNPYEVLCRDKWTCQICGIRTPRSLRGSYAPDAPEVDHINPLALGGSHTLENLQCACRACNLRKGAKGTPSGVVARLEPRSTKTDRKSVV